MNRYAEARHFCHLLSEAGFPTMMAGGCVRDRLLGIEPKDFDLATTALPEQAMRFFKTKGYKVIPTGLKHGTISVVSEQQTIEVTTLRHDVACDGRHADVAFSNDFRQDALRRDFTINALFEDSQGKVHDYVGGQQDLQAQQLRFVGDAAERISEDYLRILRYFRFLARYGWQPLPDQVTAISLHRAGLEQLSIERIQAEMDQILASPSLVLPQLFACGIIDILFPALNPSFLAETTALLHALQPENVPEGAGDRAGAQDVRWFTFFYFGAGGMDADTMEQQTQRMRFTRKGVKTMTGLARFLALDAQDPQRLMLALQWHEQGLLPAPFLEWYLDRIAFLAKGDPVAPLLRQLLAGLVAAVPYTTPREALQALAPAIRGESIKIAKIYWYLGLCHDSNGVSKILAEAQTFKQHLVSGKPRPVL